MSWKKITGKKLKNSKLSKNFHKTLSTTEYFFVNKFIGYVQKVFIRHSKNFRKIVAVTKAQNSTFSEIRNYFQKINYAIKSEHLHALWKLQLEIGNLLDFD